MIRHQPDSLSQSYGLDDPLRVLLQRAGVSDELVAREVASGVVQYFHQNAPSALLPDHSVGWVLARALGAVGETEPAESLLEEWVGCSDAHLVREFLQKSADFSVATGTLFHSRIFRVGEWHFESRGAVWIVDLGRIRVTPDHCFELSLGPALFRLMEKLVSFWRPSPPAAVWFKGIREFVSSVSSCERERSYLQVQVELWCRQALENACRQAGIFRYPRVLISEGVRERRKAPGRCSPSYSANRTFDHQ